MSYHIISYHVYGNWSKVLCPGPAILRESSCHVKAKLGFGQASHHAHTVDSIDASGLLDHSAMLAYYRHSID